MHHQHAWPFPAASIHSITNYHRSICSEPVRVMLWSSLAFLLVCDRKIRGGVEPAERTWLADRVKWVFWLCNERKRRSDALFFQISLVTIDDRLVSTHCLKDCVNHRRVSRSTRRQLWHRLNGWVRIRNEPTLIYMRMYVWATFCFLFVQAPVSWSHPVCVDVLMSIDLHMRSFVNIYSFRVERCIDTHTRLD